MSQVNSDVAKLLLEPATFSKTAHVYPFSASVMLRLLRDGSPVWETSSGEETAWLAQRLAAGRELTLLKLAGEELDVGWPDWLKYWQRLAKEFLKRSLVASRLGAADVPSQTQLKQWCDEAPIHAAWELATPEALSGLWERFQQAFAAWVARHEENVEAAVAALAPTLVNCGKVTFHLVENKQSQEFPFAFVGTYAQLGKEGRPTQVPIGKMLREAAKVDDIAALRGVLEPLRQAVQANEFLAELVESQRIFQALAFTPAEALAFLKATPVLAEVGIATRIPNWWQGKKSAKPQVLVTVEQQDEDKDGVGGAKDEAKEGGGMLKFNVRLALQGENLSAEELQKILDTDAPLVSLKGQWVEVDAAKLKAALQLWQKATVAQAQGIPLAVGLRWIAAGGAAAAPVLGAEAADLADWMEITAGEEFSKRLAEFSANEPSTAWPYGDAGSELPGITATLRPYQLRGVQWLWAHARMAWGACLADDMGLGKTLQVISLLAIRKAEGINRPTLIVAPASLLGNWRQEFHKFSPELKVLTLHRSQMTAAEVQRIASGQHPALQRHGVILTTYGMVLRQHGLAGFLWDGVILDEAQAIKNAETGQSAAVRALQATYRIAMTGTPVENRLTELWSLFAFLNPGYLGTLGEFETLVKRCKDTGEGYGRIRKLVQPFLLRRVKSDPEVAPDLPGKTEVTAWCRLAKRQALLYQRAIKGLKEQLAASKEDPAARAAALLGILLKLKQICNHPSLFAGDGEWEPSDSGKFKRLRELAEQIHANGEKLLIFTQFREMTDVLHRELTRLFRRPGLILHGGTPIAKRPELVAEFQSPTGPPFFVISLKAGGTGLNLTAASQVVHFDRWWNPAVEDQATDRAYRIGQKNPVLVHKFVCQGTLEERIDAIITEKKQLADEILADGGTAEQLLLGLTDDALEDFLKLSPEEEEELI